MNYNERAEEAEQRMIDEHDREFAESIAHEIARDVARLLTPEWANQRGDFWAGLAAKIDDPKLKRRYLSIGSVYHESAWYVQRTQPKTRDAA